MHAMRITHAPAAARGAAGFAGRCSAATVVPFAHSSAAVITTRQLHAADARRLVFCTRRTFSTMRSTISSPATSSLLRSSSTASINPAFNRAHSSLPSAAASLCAPSTALRATLARLHASSSAATPVSALTQRSAARPLHTHALGGLRSDARADTTLQQPAAQQSGGEQKQNGSGSNSNNSSSSSSSSSNPFLRLWAILRAAFDWYASKLDSNPVLTQSLTSGFLFLIGDLTAQRYEARLDASKGIDVSDRPFVDFLRLAACTSFGLFVLGPCGHHWYSRLDVFTNRLYAPRSWRNVGLKVALDTAIFNPIFLVVFFTTVSLLEGLSLADIGRKLWRDFVPSYAVDCSIWPPIQTINFRVVPVKFQLLVVNLGCYFDDVFLSYVQHNGMPAIFQRVEKWWLQYIGDEQSGHGGHGHGHGKAAAVKDDGKAAALVAVPSVAAEEELLVEVLPHPAGKSTVKIVPSSSAHPHHPHSHPVPAAKLASAEAAAPSPHHHLVPRVLAEDVKRLPRAHGIDVGLVEELDADWTDVPASEEDQQRAVAKASIKNNIQQSQSKPSP